MHKSIEKLMPEFDSWRFKHKEDVYSDNVTYIFKSHNHMDEQLLRNFIDWLREVCPNDGLIAGEILRKDKTTGLPVFVKSDNATEPALGYIFNIPEEYMCRFEQDLVVNLLTHDLSVEKINNLEIARTKHANMLNQFFEV